MIPDFLPNPGSVPNPGPRPAPSEAGPSTTETQQSTSFARALREKPESKAPAESVPRDEADRAGDAESPDTAKQTAQPASATRGKDAAQQRSEPQTDEAQSANSRRPADDTLDATRSRPADRVGETAGAAPGDTSKGSNTAEERSLDRVATPGSNEDDVAGGSASAARDVSSSSASVDDVQSAGGPAGNQPASPDVVSITVETQIDVAAALLTDEFAQQAESTTSTDADLQLVTDSESDSEVDSAAQTADTVSAGGIGDSVTTPQIAGQSASAEQAGPLILASLVSIAIADSTASRRQQQAHSTAGQLPQDAESGTQPSQSTQAVDGSGVPINADETLPQNPVLPSLAAAKSGKQANPAVGAQFVQTQSGEGSTAPSADASQATSGRVPEVVAENSSASAQRSSQDLASSVASGSRRETTPSTLTADLPSQAASNVDGARSGEKGQTTEQAQLPVSRRSSKVEAAGSETSATQSQIQAEQTSEPPLRGVRAAQTEQQSSPSATQPQHVEEARGQQASTTDARQISETSSSADPTVATDATTSADGGRRDPVSSARQGAGAGATERPSSTSEVSPDVEPSRRAQAADSNGSTAASAAVDQTGHRRQSDSSRPSELTDRVQEAGSGSSQSAGQAQASVPAETTRAAVETAASNLAADTSAQQTAAQTGTEEAASVSAEGSPRVESTLPPASAVSQSATNELSATIPFTDAVQSSTPEGGERFLSPNIQRALTAIQSAASGGNRLRVHLNPQELGSLLVDIVQTPQGIVARLEVATPAAQQMLIDSLADLQQSLTRTQSPVERIDIVLSDVRTETSRQQREQQQERGHQQQQRGDADSQQHRRQDERGPNQQPEQTEDGGSIAEAA